MKIFLITIETENDQKEWNYKPGTIVIIPIKSHSSYHAQMKFENKCCGSEYPPYKIISIKKCDEFLFQPML